MITEIVFRGQVSGDHPIVLFVDEIEQKYKSLDEIVQTDDHSPMKEALRAVERGDAGFYLVSLPSQASVFYYRL